MKHYIDTSSFYQNEDSEQARKAFAELAVALGFAVEDRFVDYLLNYSPRVCVNGAGDLFTSGASERTTIEADNPFAALCEVKRLRDEAAKPSYEGMAYRSFYNVTATQEIEIHTEDSTYIYLRREDLEKLLAHLAEIEAYEAR